MLGVKSNLQHFYAGDTTTLSHFVKVELHAVFSKVTMGQNIPS